MSALLIDLPVEDLAPRRWVHVETGSRPARQEARRAPLHRSVAPLARSAQGRAPDGRPLGVGAPRVRPATAAPSVRPAAAARPVASGLWLTRRGLAVVVGLFAALMAVSAVVLVTGFLSVSNDPVVPAGVTQVQRG